MQARVVVLKLDAKPDKGESKNAVGYNKLGWSDMPSDAAKSALIKLSQVFPSNLMDWPACLKDNIRVFCGDDFSFQHTG